MKFIANQNEFKLIMELQTLIKEVSEEIDVVRSTVKARLDAQAAATAELQEAGIDKADVEAIPADTTTDVNVGTEATVIVVAENESDETIKVHASRAAHKQQRIKAIINELFELNNGDTVNTKAKNNNKGKRPSYNNRNHYRNNG